MYTQRRLGRHTDHVAAFTAVVLHNEDVQSRAPGIGAVHFREANKIGGEGDPGGGLRERQVRNGHSDQGTGRGGAGKFSLQVSTTFTTLLYLILKPCARVHSPKR